MGLLTVNGQLDKKRLAASVLLPVAGGSLVGAMASKNAKEKYDRLETPSFGPPGWVFPVAWTTLYTMMGLAKYRKDMRVQQQNEKAVPVDAYYVQLGLNFLWSFLFFRWERRGAALAEIAALLAVLLLTAVRFAEQDKTAGMLMIPYAAWVSFALLLNASIWQLNR